MLSTVNVTLDLDEQEYEKQLIYYQVGLFRLAYQVYVQQRPVIIVFEGWELPVRAAPSGG